jgi:hypothetical protein
MEEFEREGWGTILWEKFKFLWAIFFFLVLDLGLVALWAGVLYGFHKIIHLIDPTNSLILLVILKWFVEVSTSIVVVYSTIEDVRKAIRRIRYGPKQILTAGHKLPDSESERSLKDEERQQQTTDRIPSERVP